MSTIPLSIGHAGYGDPRVVTAMAEWIQSIIYLYLNRPIWKGSTPFSNCTCSSA